MARKATSVRRRRNTSDAKEVSDERAGPHGSGPLVSILEKSHFKKC